jgi:hypothetical protein
MNVAKWPGSAAIRKGLLLACAFLVCAVGASAAQAAVVGTLDASYADPSPVAPHHQPTAPTGEKPQSKLWFNDGIWWGSIWSKTKFTIQGYDAAGTWADTGVTIDPRDKSQADMLWDGTHLYAISNVHEASSTLDPSVRLYRFSYNATAKTYSLDAGFPVSIISPASNPGMTTTDLETVVMDKDSTGMLWATFTLANQVGLCTAPGPVTCPAGRSVYIAHSTVGNDAAWSTPALLPSADGRTANVSGNDISSIVHFGNKIGVMYSDQVPDPVVPVTQPVTSRTGDYFAVHIDGHPDTEWTQETALVGKRAADDHINLKAAPDGTLFAAVKTSANDASVPVATDPLVYLLKRSTGGTWTKTTFATVATQDTRSSILLDPTHNVVYQFATYPPDGAYEGGGKIYCKVTSMTSPSFVAGIGDPFIDLAAGDHLNNFSTTKQTVGPATGLLGIAADDHNLHYAHNSLTLTGTPSCLGTVVVPPVVPVPPPPPVVKPPVVTPPVVTPPVVTPLVVTPPVVKPPVVTPPVVQASAPPCRVVSSSIKVRSLSTRLSSLKRTSSVRLQIKATCSLRLRLAAALGTKRGAVVGRASVYLKKGEKKTVRVHLTRAGRGLIAHKAYAKVFVTARTPAVTGLSPARAWSTTIVFHS